MGKKVSLPRFMRGLSGLAVGSAGMFGAALAALVFTGSAAWAQVGSVPLGGPLAQPCVVPDDPLESPAVPCLAILQLAEGSTSDQRTAVALGAGAIVRHDFQFANAAAVFVPNELAFWSLVDDSQVLEFIPDRINHLFVQPEGKGKPKNKEEPTPTEITPSGVARIGAPSAWDVSTGYGIGVAIADSGIDLLHGDLNVASPCFSVTDTCQDEAGHGTHVAGIVAALEGNSLDVAGVAPDATLYAVRVFAGNSAPDSDIMAGLTWIFTNPQSPPIKVVNMSFGRPGEVNDNPAYQKLITALADSGVILVAAAGNDYGADVSTRIPAAYAEVAAIASSTAKEGGNNRCRFTSKTVPADSASYFTNDGSGVALSAPGERKEDITRGCGIKFDGILSTALGGGTTRMAGTSMAAPHYAGAAALLLGDGVAAWNVESTLRDAAIAGPLPNPFIADDGTKEGILCVSAAVGREAC